MTKTLTDKWREGTLPRGYYYCKLYYNNFEPRIQECVKSRYDSKSCIPMSCGCGGEEVLAPVPSYDEFVQQRDFVKDQQKVLIENMNLKGKLEIATKALKEFKRSEDTYLDYSIDKAGNKIDLHPNRVATNALKEMEGVK